MGRQVSILICVLSAFLPWGQAWFLPRFSRNVCYRSPDVGCFPTSYPYNISAGIAPQSPHDLAVVFRLTRRGGNTDRVFSLHNVHQRIASVYQPAEKTVVLIHGYYEHGNIGWLLQLKEELLRKESMNVITVDWGLGANTFIYFQSVADTRVVGALIALMLQELRNLGGNPATFHLVGFSLGAHVAGQAGQRLPGLARITGLDPAGPSFDGAHPLARLDAGDAEFVDVIHSDTSTPLSLGAHQPMGDVDYYLNGGGLQPGCTATVVDSITSISSAVANQHVPTVVACSHFRAVAVFTSSIRFSCSLTTYRCPHERALDHSSCERCQGPGSTQCPRMGYNLPTDMDSLGGIYRVDTTASHPFC